VNTTTQRITNLLALTAIGAALAACGGGGSSSDSAGSGSNVFEGMQGTYVVACDGWADPYGLNESWSNDGSITVSELVGSDRANVSIRSKGYKSPAGDTSGGHCDSTKLDGDITVTGQIRDLGTTKVYTGPTGAPVTAKIVEFTYFGFTLAKGSLSGTIPLPNATTQIGFVLDGKNLYLGKGTRGADGLAKELGKRFGVKQ
jgi:hypothetical protein